MSDIKLGNNDITLKVGSTDVDAIYLGSTLMYSGGTPPTPSYDTEYLTFVATESGTFTFTPQNSNVISYSTDNGTTWTEGNSVSVNANDKVLWKGTMTPATNSGIGKFSSTCAFTVEGNAHSLLWGDNFEGQTNLSSKKYAFDGLFSGCTGLTSAENMILPATTLSNYCYAYMFSDCTSLTTAPELPATTLASTCYGYMFNGCTSLTTAPVLSATTLAFSCYYYMFNACTNLTTAPVLSATTLASYCYSNMFGGCTSLTTAPSLPATTLANYCYSWMFSECTSLTIAPVLSATTLNTQCYYYMFYHCTRLNSITCLATNISASNCTTNWVTSVAANGTFTKASSMNDWTTGVNGIPSGWTVQDYSS